MRKGIFTGSGVALVTPFNEKGEVNYKKLAELIDYHIDNNTDAIIIAGTTGESATLTTKEHEKVIEFAIQYANKRIPIIAGAGSNCTREAVNLAKKSDKAGADGLLIVTPYYNKCTQKGLLEHYKLIAKKVDTPIILYNVPSRTGVNIEPQTAIELSKIPNIVGLKEASGNLEQAKQIIDNVDRRFSVYSGNDDQITDLMEIGGKGVISVLANVCPQATHELCKLALEGRIEESRKLQIEYLELVKQLFSEVNPIPVKAALNHLGKEVGSLRLPLTEMSPENKKILIKTLKQYDQKGKIR